MSLSTCRRHVTVKAARVCLAWCLGMKAKAERMAGVLWITVLAVGGKMSKYAISALSWLLIAVEQTSPALNSNSTEIQFRPTLCPLFRRQQCSWWRPRWCRRQRCNSAECALLLSQLTAPSTYRSIVVCCIIRPHLRPIMISLLAFKRSHFDSFKPRLETHLGALRGGLPDTPKLSNVFCILEVLTASDASFMSMSIFITEGRRSRIDAPLQLSSSS